MEPAGEALTKEISPGDPIDTIASKDLQTITKRSYTSLIQTSQGRWACPECKVTATHAGNYWVHLRNFGFEFFLLDSDRETQPSVSGRSFKSDDSDDSTPVQPSSVGGMEPSEDPTVTHFRKEAASHHQLAWDDTFYRTSTDDCPEFAAFLNPPQVFRCLDNQKFVNGELGTRPKRCGFSRVPYSTMTRYYGIQLENAENKEQLQGLIKDFGIPSAKIAEGTITQFACPACIVYAPDLERHQAWKTYVEGEPKYQRYVHNPLAKLIEGAPPASDWLVYVNDLSEPEPKYTSDNMPVDNSYVPGVMCQNRQFGSGAEVPGQPCYYIWGDVVGYRNHATWGISGQALPPNYGKIPWPTDDDAKTEDVLWNPKVGPAPTHSPGAGLSVNPGQFKVPIPPPRPE